MQEHGVPGDVRVHLGRPRQPHARAASGPGEARLPAAARRLRHGVRRVLQAARRPTGSTRATRSSSSPSTRVTTSQAAPDRPTRRTGCAHLHAPALPGHGGDADVPVEPDRRDHDEPEGARSRRASRRSTCTSTTHRRSTSTASRTEPIRRFGSWSGTSATQRRSTRTRAAPPSPITRAPRRPGRGRSTLHMVNADPKRTPTFTLFGQRRLLLPGRELRHVLAVDSPSASTRSSPGTTATSRTRSPTPGSAMVGPGVEQQRRRHQTWTDHVDVRPTMHRAPRPAGSTTSTTAG